MPPRKAKGKFHDLLGHWPYVKGQAFFEARSEGMGALALVMFISVFGFGNDLMGWSDPDGQVQLALFMSFVFGIICGYRTSGS